ncbi:MAG: acetyl-CoA C-acetyltransferase [Gammaproteobacteria bacterium]
MSFKQAHYDRSVFIVDGCRTPFLKAGNKPGPFMASDLAVMTGKTLLERQPFAPTEVDEVIIGCVMPREDEANIARVISLRLGCGKSVPAWTVQRNCGSGMQALDSAFKDISCGRHDLVLAGGTEAMSQAPLIANQELVNWLGDLRHSKNLLAKLKVILQFRPHFLVPIIALIHGLTDPTVGMIMGQTAENLAYLFNITREQMDEYSFLSHQRAIAAEKEGHLTEITPLYSQNGVVYEVDTGVRHDTSLEKLAKLKPIFDKFGRVTAGNSAQVTDGAALLILASQDAIQRYNLPVLGRIIDVNWAGVEPESMGLGPVFATTPLLQRHGMGLEDIDYWEINEAFAAQVLACLAAWQDEKFCHKRLGLNGAFGKIDLQRLNVDGGAIAMGHPVGASGARIVLHLLEVLKRNNAKIGMATLCIGGGQGGAMLLERL